MMPLGTPQQVHALRQQLWDAGFRPVPIYSPDAAHDAAGKAPRGADWGDKARLDPPAAVAARPTADALNTGILCDGLRAIDIDVDNATIAHSVRAQCLAMFGETAMRYRDNSPRALLVYRAAEGTPTKRVLAGTFGKVEVLGKGQQFVGFGVHPSGADLRWMPEPLGEIDVGSLRALTEDEITAFLAAVAPSIGADVAKAKAPNGATPRPDRKLGADALQVLTALSAIPNAGPPDWEAWNRMGMATWAATGGGEAGRAAFHAWSEAHPAYDPTETNARWDHYATSPPTQIGAGTLFYLAQQARQTHDDGGLNEPVDFDIAPPAEGHEPSEEMPPQEAPAPRPAKTRPGIPIIYWDEITPALDANDFVEGLLIKEAMSVTYGQSNSGKTFFDLDLALHIAAGLPWRGRAVEQGGVIWLAMEGSFGIRNRVEAWKRERGLEDARLPFAVVPVALNLLDPNADTDRLIDLIAVAAERMGMPVQMIVVDTLSRAIAGGNENAPDDMGALVSNGTKIQQRVKAHVHWIHHSGKDEAKGARGHSLLRAATDTEIEITADGAQRVARVTKQRELDCAGDFPFSLKVVELGTNKRGKPVTSCVVEGPGEGHTEDRLHGAPNVLTPRLKGHVRRALDVLHDLLAESGKGGFPDVPHGLPSVPEEWWRQRFYDRTLSDGKDDLKQDSKRAAFNRSVSELIDRRIVAVNKGRVWVCRPQTNGQTEGQTE